MTGQNMGNFAGHHSRYFIFVLHDVQKTRPDKNIKMIYAFGQSYLTQVVPDKKSGIVRYKICLFIKVFTMIADR